MATTATPGAPTQDERLRVLELVASGRVTPEQGAELLRALQAAPASTSESDHSSRAPGGGANWLEALGLRRPADAGYGIAPSGTPDGAQWLRVRVSDRQRRTLADVQLPLTAVGLALRLGGRWVPQLRLLDSAFLLATLRLRQGQSVFRYEDSAGGERIEITAE